MNNDPTSILAALGITREDVLDACVNKVLNGEVPDGNWEESWVSSVSETVSKRIHDERLKLVNECYEKVRDSAARQVAEHLGEMIIEPTTGYGEKKGEPLTMREYICGRAGKELGLVYKKDSYGRVQQGDTTLPKVILKALNEVIDREAKTIIKEYIHEAGGVIQVALKATTANLNESLRLAVEGAQKSVDRNEVLGNG